MELWILNYIKIYNMFILSYNATSTGLVFISLKTMHSMTFIEKIIMNISMLETVLQPYRNQCLLSSNNALEDQTSRFLSKARSILFWFYVERMIGHHKHKHIIFTKFVQV